MQSDIYTPGLPKIIPVQKIRFFAARKIYQVQKREVLQQGKEMQGHDNSNGQELCLIDLFTYLLCLYLYLCICVCIFIFLCKKERRRTITAAAVIFMDRALVLFVQKISWYQI